MSPTPNRDVNQSLFFPFWGAGPFKDAGVWHRSRRQLDKHQSGNRGGWLWQHPSLSVLVLSLFHTGGTEVQSGYGLLPSTGVIQAFDLGQQQALCVHDCTMILCGLMPAADGNLAPPDICISFLEPPGHHWATQSTLNSFHTTREKPPQ